MSSDSFEEFIYPNRPEKTPPLSWEILRQIAIGIARGLAYLHRGCNHKILHLDIKPENIIWDENLCPKITYFGFIPRFVTGKRTLFPCQVLDPRWIMRYVALGVLYIHFGGVSNKIDVYIYSVVLLEIVGRGYTSVLKSFIPYQWYLLPHGLEEAKNNTFSFFFFNFLFPLLNEELITCSEFLFFVMHNAFTLLPFWHFISSITFNRYFIQCEFE